MYQKNSYKSIYFMDIFIYIIDVENKNSFRLICFGDSWTAGHGVETEKAYKEQAIVREGKHFIDRLRNMNSWPRWVSDKLECLYVNMGVCGHGNQQIYQDIKEVKNSKFIGENDIVIVMLSYPYRFMNPGSPSVPELFFKIEEELKNYKHFYFNSFFPTFQEEENFDYTTLPDCFISPKTCVSQLLEEYEIQNDVSVWEYGSRKVWKYKSEYMEGGFHPNLLGYKLISEYIYKEIKDKI